jgi:hypothetical protein
MKKLTVLLAALAMSMAVVAPVGAHTRTGSGSERQVSWAEVVQEKSHSDAPATTKTRVGWSRLVRTSNGLQPSVFVRGFEPGGVYTFWWVSPYEFVDNGDPDSPNDPDVPSGVFVARGAGRVNGASGTAFVRMRARIGQDGIEGLPVLDGALWSEMRDPLTSIVRIEIAYHGQADEAGSRANLRTWLSDFWTGTAWSVHPATNDGGQPHCPVYIAATHTP